MTYATVLLEATHNKEDFTCGNPLLDGYLHRQARQDMKRRLAACFVLSADGQDIKGYYTLSAASVLAEHIPKDIAKKLPPAYHHLPVTLLGRLAVATTAQGTGVGSALLIDALRRSYDTSVTNVAAMAVIVDPIDEAATRFYSKYGFMLLPHSGKMFLPMKTIEQLF